jgi:hypothetical protein
MWLSRVISCQAQQAVHAALGHVQLFSTPGISLTNKEKELIAR